jgi:hypothetical protein
MKKGLLTILLLSVLVAPLLANGNIVTFTCPVGGESWFPGRQIKITYSFSQAVSLHYVQLYKNNVYLGPMHTNSNSYSPGQAIILDWPAGSIADLNTHPITNVFVQAGGGYRIAISLINYDGPPMAFSGPFTILDISVIFSKYNKLAIKQVPVTGGCPECFILDLAGLRDELVQLNETMTLNLFYKGKLVANLGNIGMGKGFVAKLQVKLDADALAAVKRGDEFELRLFNGTGKQINAQAVHLLTSGR